MGQCKTKRCANNTPKRGGKFCYTCRNKKYKKKNPMRYCYQTLKDNAKRRGKLFDLTFDQFKSFAIENKLLMGKGRTATSYTVDRIKNHLGYTANNLQVLTLSENASKGTRELVYDYRTGFATYTKPQRNNNEIKAPF